MGKTTYSHHISYWSNWRPTSVTTTNNSTWKTTTKGVWWWGRWWSRWWSSSSNSNTTYKYNATTWYYEPVWWSSWWSRWWSSWWSSSSNNYATKYANNSAYQSLVKKYWASNVWNALDYMTSWWKVDKSQLNSILSWNSKYSNQTSSVSWTSWNDNKKDDYTTASVSNYNNALNHLKSQGMSDADAKAAASGLLEKQDLLKNKTEEEKAAEMWPVDNQEEERDPMDTMNEVFTEGEDPYDYHQSQEWQDLMWEIDYYKNRVDDLSSQLESNTVKTSIPEERDTSYDYNTYYKENLAPDNNYENWESKNTLNDKPQTTLVSQYQEPVTTALNDLGLLTPNEEASASMPNTEEQPAAPKTYTSWEEIVSEFNNTLEQMWQEGWTGLAPQAVAQTYMEYKKKLDDYVNNNRLSAEEADALLSQLKSNKTLNSILRK